MVVRFAAVVLVQRVEPRVGLVAEGLGSHGAEVKVEAVQEEVNFDPGPPGLRAHGWSRAQDEGGAVHSAASLVLQGNNTAGITMLFEKNMRVYIFIYIYNLFYFIVFILFISI